MIWVKIWYRIHPEKKITRVFGESFVKIGAMKAIFPSWNVNEFPSVPARFTVNDLGENLVQNISRKKLPGFLGRVS